jgi:hypothetical protein
MSGSLATRIFTPWRDAMNRCIPYLMVRMTTTACPYLSGLFGLAFVGLPVGSVMFLPSGLVAGPCEPDSWFFHLTR